MCNPYIRNYARIFLYGLIVFFAINFNNNVKAQDLRINQIQILGSHNSYKKVPDAEIIENYKKMGQEGEGLKYGHTSISNQLDLGLRQFEFDPYSDTKGGLFQGAYPPNSAEAIIMRQKGAKVLHIAQQDYKSHCLTLKQCLAIVAGWSDANKSHDTIFILINISDSPEAFTETALNEIDELAISIFGKDRLIMPDDVRGNYKTLRDSVLANNWPLSKASHGKVVLILDAGDDVENLYRLNHPSLKNRVMFGFYDENTPEAAIFNIQDPRTSLEKIQKLVKAGFIVRTRADAETVEAKNKDNSRIKAAIASGAQLISTDYYEGAPDPFNFKFIVKLENGFSQKNYITNNYK